MKVKTFALVTAAGMVATSVAVWSSTRSHQAGREADVRQPEEHPDVKDPAPDRSTFRVGHTLTMEGRLGHALLPAATDSETYLFVDVAAASTRAARRAKLDLSIVIDRSGSMKGRRLKNAVAAARTAIGRLDDGDAVSVVTYDTRTHVLVPRTILAAANRDEILGHLSRVRAGGNTCISCGVQAGMNLIGRAPGRVRRILLLSDGKATAGVRDLPGFRRIARRCQRMETSVTTIGVDIDYNEQIMSAIARESNGRHFFVQNPSGLPAVFDEEMEALQQTVANDTELTVDLSPGVFVSRILDRSFRREGSRVVVPLGSFSAGDHKTLLMQVRVPRGPTGERPIAAVHLDYDDLAGDSAGRCEGQLAARMTDDPSKVSPLDGLVAARVSRSETAATLEQANKLFRRGKIEEARDLVAKRKRSLHARREETRAALPASRRADFDDAFDSADSALAGATGGFTQGPAEGEAQAKGNEQASFDLSE